MGVVGVVGVVVGVVGELGSVHAVVQREYCGTYRGKREFLEFLVRLAQ